MLLNLIEMAKVHDGHYGSGAVFLHEFSADWLSFGAALGQLSGGYRGSS
jgi:hypothetical protein